MTKELGVKLMEKFNQVIGGHLRINNPDNVGKMQSLYDEGLSIDGILNTAEDWYAENPNPNMDTAMVKFYSFALRRAKTGTSPTADVWTNGKRTVEPAKVTPMPEPEPTPTQKPVTEPATASSNASNDMAGFMSGMINLVADQVVRTKTDEIAQIIENKAVDRVEQFIHDTYGELPKKVIVKINDEEIRTVKGITHEKFEDVLNCVKRHLNVFMVGGAGTGKNVLAEQIAEALGVPFYYGGAITQEYKLTGFTDANGVYHETPFYKAFTTGGVYFQDEYDASIAEAAIITNAATANGYMDFPAPIGNVKAHKDFYFIAAGNTYGLGADYEYVGRNVLDAATLNRMIVIPIDYSPKIEEAMANNDTELLMFCRRFREAVRKCGVKALCTYRNIKAMATLQECMPIESVISYALVPSMKYDDLNVISEYLSGCGKWSSGCRKVMDEKRRLIG